MTKVDISWLVGTIIAAILFLAGVLAGVLALVWRRTAPKVSYDDFTRNERTGIAVSGAALALVVAGMYIGLSWPPFNMEYHSYRLVGGEIAQIESRLLAGEKGGATQNFVVVFDGSDQEYRCDDSRCATVAEGDELWLWCIRVWQQASTPGYVCNFDRAVRTP